MPESRAAILARLNERFCVASTLKARLNADGTIDPHEADAIDETIAWSGLRVDRTVDLRIDKTLQLVPTKEAGVENSR